MEENELYMQEFLRHITEISYYFGRLAAMRHDGLTQVEFVLLHQIYTRGGQKPEGEVVVGELMSGIPHNKAAISKMLGSMEKKELIRRRPSPQNRRYVLVSMTEKGWALFSKNDKADMERNWRTINTVGRERVMQMLETMEECVRLQVKNREDVLAEEK